MSLRASAIFRGSSCVKLASLILAMSLRASSIFRRNSDIVRWWSYTCVDVWASPPRHLVISRTLGDEAVDERRFGDRPARSIGQRSRDEHTRKGHARAGSDGSRAAPRLQAGVPARPACDVERTPRLTSQLKGESTVTPVHAFNLEVHEVDLRGARTRFLLDSLETTLCAVRTMRTGSRPRPTRRRTNKINWRRRRTLRLLTAGSRRCGLSRFLRQSLGGGSGGGRSPGRKSCVVVRYQIEPCARV